jgi:hypothetical protein
MHAEQHAASPTSSLIPIHVEHEGSAWPLWRQDEGEEPLIRDLDWGERLGYDRPRNIRKLIKGLAEAGKLGLVVRFAAERTSLGGAPTDEYYLTEAQALLVAAKSETEPAFQILQAMIAVFLTARRGGLRPAPSNEEDLRYIISLQAELLKLRGRAPAPAPRQWETHAHKYALGFLRATLANGPRTVSDIKEEAAAERITLTTLRRAKKALGVLSKKEPGVAGVWSWSLPKT